MTTPPSAGPTTLVSWYIPKLKDRADRRRCGGTAFGITEVRATLSKAANPEMSPARMKSAQTARVWAKARTARTAAIATSAACVPSSRFRLSNRSAIAMYQRFGFRPSGHRRRYYHDNGEDALVMWLEPEPATA